MSTKGFNILMLVALLTLPILAWFKTTRVILMVILLPLVVFSTVSGDHEMLASMKARKEAFGQWLTAKNQLKTAQTQEQTTQTARDAAEHESNANATFGHTLREVPVFECDWATGKVASKLDPDGRPLILDPGQEFLTWTSKPQVHVLQEPAYEVLLPDKNNSYISQARLGKKDVRLFITARTDYVRLENKLTAPLPLWEMEQVDDYMATISPTDVGQNFVFADQLVPQGNRLLFAQIDPPPAPGDLEIAIGFERRPIKIGLNVEVPVTSKPIYIIKPGAGPFKMYVQQFGPKGSAARGEPLASPPPAPSQPSAAVPSPTAAMPTEVPSVTLRITNSRQNNIYLNWIDESDESRRWGTIPPGRTLRQKSYLVPGQWVVLDENGVSLEKFPPPTKDTHKII